MRKNTSKSQCSLVCTLFTTHDLSNALFNTFQYFSTQFTSFRSFPSFRIVLLAGGTRQRLVFCYQISFLLSFIFAIVFFFENVLQFSTTFYFYDGALRFVLLPDWVGCFYESATPNESSNAGNHQLYQQFEYIVGGLYKL